MFDDVGKNLAICNNMLHMHDKETIIERELADISRRTFNTNVSYPREFSENKIYKFGVNVMDDKKVVPMCGYSAEKEDAVNHPKHYKTGKIECIDCISAIVNMYDGEQAYDVGQVIKYLYRAPTKMNFMQDLKKAQWYLNRLIKIASKQSK